MRWTKEERAKAVERGVRLFAISVNGRTANPPRGSLDISGHSSPAIDAIIDRAILEISKAIADEDAEAQP